jgi:nitrogen-specific signal transduction histidine kinase/CheY-like chemotaxis protein
MLTLGGRRGRLAVLEDVTRRTELEQQVRQSQKMEAIGRLAGGVAHDFNNLLSVILSYADMLATELEGQPPLGDVKEIQRAAARAAELTQRLLSFSRQQVLAPRVLDLNHVLADMGRMLRRILGEDVRVVSVPGSQLGRVHLDPVSVEQIIMNLAVNARDAMPRGGKLTLETANVTLGDDYANEHFGVRPGHYVMLAMTDTGVGMDRATLDRIFEPFFTTKERGKGTGLGLATVFGIVRQSGGYVWPYSEPGKGTTFKLYFPRVEEEVEARRPARAAVAAGTETILLVEDEEQIRVVARRILARHGYQVLEARNGAEALSLWQQHHAAISLLLTDVVMPEMSGPALARQLTASRPSLKVLYMSGYTDDAVVRHGVLEGEVAFLQKPFTPSTLGAKVREVLDGAAPA